MLTPEHAQQIGITKKERSEVNSVIRNCPVYLDIALDTLAYLMETQFQFVKDIQLHACLIGFNTIRDSIHVCKYKEIISKLYYGNNPEINISLDQRSKLDSFEFAGSKLSRVLNFKMPELTRNGLYALSQKLNIVQCNLDMMVFVIGYHELLLEEYNKYPEKFNPQNIDLLNTLSNECKRIDKFFELRTIHKIIEYCPISIDYSKNSLEWRM